MVRCVFAMCSLPDVHACDRPSGRAVVEFPWATVSDRDTRQVDVSDRSRRDGQRLGGPRLVSRSSARCHARSWAARCASPQVIAAERQAVLRDCDAAWRDAEDDRLLADRQ